MSEVDLRIDMAILASLLQEAREATGIQVIFDPQCGAGLEAQNLTRSEFKLCKEGECCRRKLRVALDRFTTDGSTRRDALAKLIDAIREFWGGDNVEPRGFVYIAY